jgi:predicted Zn-dependent protease
MVGIFEGHRAEAEHDDESVARLVRLFEVVERGPSLGELADTAMRHRNWPEALLRWEQSLALAAEDATAELGRANALLELGRLDEAEQAFAELATRWPECESGPIGLALVAQRSGDWQLALSRLSDVLNRFPTVAGIRRSFVNVLIKLDRQDDAVTFAIRHATAAATTEQVAMTAAVLQSRQETRRLIELFDAHPSRFLKIPGFSIPLSMRC